MTQDEYFNGQIFRIQNNQTVISSVQLCHPPSEKLQSQLCQSGAVVALVGYYTWSGITHEQGQSSTVVQPIRILGVGVPGMTGLKRES